jgi:hypothetical protein
MTKQSCLFFETMKMAGFQTQDKNRVDNNLIQALDLQALLVALLQLFFMYCCRQAKSTVVFTN